MKIRRILFIAIAVAGAGAGAMGSRTLASAPDINSIADFPFMNLAFVVPCLVLICWAFSAALGRYSLPLFYCLVALGVYGACYGLFELLFHSINGRPALSASALAAFGGLILLSCYLSSLLFSKKVLEA